jgi:hypothetical protein
VETPANLDPRLRGDDVFLGIQYGSASAGENRREAAVVTSTVFSTEFNHPE